MDQHQLDSRSDEKNDDLQIENTENISPVARNRDNDVSENEENRRIGTRFKRRLPGKPSAEGNESKNFHAAGEELDSRNQAPKMTKDRRNVNKGAERIVEKPAQQGYSSYDMTVENAVKLERMAGPTGCLPCSTWNHLCGMGFKMTGYIPAYEKLHTSINASEVNKNWLTVTIGGLMNMGGRLSRAVCPNVRVHLVYMHSGEYIMSVPMISLKEHSENESKEGCPLAPLNTAPCHLRSHDAEVRWEETFIIDAQFTDVTNPNALLLFEVLDNPPSIKKSNHSTSGSKKGKFSACLAWGYLIPRGTRARRLNFALPRPEVKKPRETIDHIPFDDSEMSEHDNRKAEKSPLLQETTPADENLPYLPARVQLYEYRNESWLIEGVQRRAMKWQPQPSHGLMKTPTVVSSNSNNSLSGYRIVPEVYLQWRRQKHVKAEGSLSVVMSYQPRSAKALGHILSHEIGLGVDALPAARQRENEDKQSLAKEEAERAALRAAVSRRSRSANEPTVIPNRVLHRCQTGLDGSVVSTYSNSGIMLAVAAKSIRHSFSHIAPYGGGFSKYPGVLYSLSILDADTADKLWVDDLAHFGVIYDVKWSANDDSLVSCSADGRIKVYNVKVVSRGFREFKEGQLENILDRRSDNKRMSAPKQINAAAGGGNTLGGIAASIVVSSVGVLESFPPIFIYSIVIQESFGTTGNKGVRVLSGGSDGRIKVWDAVSCEQCGELLSYDPSKEAANLPIFFPHENPVQSMAVDAKSRYLYSGDSGGTILMWRQDNAGWYQIMRRMKKDDISGLSIQSLSIYTTPVPAGQSSNTKAYAQTKSYMLIMATPPIVNIPNNDDTALDTAKAMKPSMLQLYDLGSYKTLVNYSGFHPPVAAFTRASISRDGRYVATCCHIPSEGAMGKDQKLSFHIKCWEACTGHLTRTRLSELHWSFPVRMLDWNPKQNVIAISVSGSGAALCIMSAEKLSAKLAGVVLAEVVHSQNPVIVDVMEGSSRDAVEDNLPTRQPFSDKNRHTNGSRERLLANTSTTGRSSFRINGISTTDQSRGRTTSPSVRRVGSNAISPKAGARSPSPKLRGLSPGGPVLRTPHNKSADSNAEKTRKLKEYLDRKKAKKTSGN